MRRGRGHAGSNVSPDSGRDSAARAARLVLVGLLVAAAAGAAALSLVPYERLREHVDAFTVDRDADVTRSEFDAIVWRLRVLAAGFGALAGLLVAFGRRLDGVAADVGSSWWTAVRAAPRALLEWVERESPAYLASFALVLAVAVALRIGFLDVPMRYDEATTYNNFVSKPLYVAAANYATPNNHLLHTLLAKASVTLFGNEPWAIRLPALLAGVALVPATLALGRVLHGRTAGLIAAALVATSSTLVEYSTNARGYTIVALLTVAAFLAAARALDTGSVGAWSAVALASALGLYAVPVMLYPLGGVLLWLAVSGGRALLAHEVLRRLGATALATVLLTLALYAPVYAASGVRSVTANEFVEPRSFGALLELFPDHLWESVQTWTRDLPAVVAVAIALAALAGMALAPAISRFPLPPVLTIVAWSIPVLALQRVVPFTRVWLFLVPLLAVSAGGCLGWLVDRRAEAARVAAPAVAGLALLAAVFVARADSVRESRETGALLDAPAVAGYLSRVVGPDDRILATGSDTILEYYLERDGVDAGPLLYSAEPRPRTYVVVNILGGQTVERLVRELNAGESGAPRLLRSYDSAELYLVERRA